GIGGGEEGWMHWRRFAGGRGYAELQDSGFLQGEKAVDEDLRAAIESDRERIELRPLRKGRTEPVEKVAEGGVGCVTQHQRMRQRIGERADADLERASVFYQGGR